MLLCEFLDRNLAFRPIAKQAKVVGRKGRETLGEGQGHRKCRKKSEKSEERVCGENDKGGHGSF